MAFQTETERLILRDIREADLTTLLAQAREPEAQGAILSYQANELYNRNYLEKAISAARFARREHYALAVVRRRDDALIGTCHVTEVRAASIETNIGWHYGKDFRNRGYATEAARRLLYIGFEIGDVAEIFADCFADNRASRRVLEKIGMATRPKLEIFNRLRGLSYGENRPTVRYLITREDWVNGKW